MVPVAECSWPTVTSVSVTASLVVLILAVAGDWAKPMAGKASAALAARPSNTLRRWNEGLSDAERCDMQYSFRGGYVTKANQG
jgi:hypothetical protein